MPYPRDDLGVELAQTTAAVMWRAFPHYEVRFGERGRRFGVSDAGYLVAMATRSPQAYSDQVVWLAGVLAARGMPSWLLECQLRHLSRLGRRKSWAGAEVVHEGMQALVDHRRRVVTDETFERAGVAFARTAGLSPRPRATGFGKMVASAFIDVDAGLVATADEFLRWWSNHIHDPRLEESIRAVEEVVRGAPRQPGA